MLDEFCCPLALEYELPPFCQYGIFPVDCIGQNLMCLPNYLLTGSAFSCAFSSLVVLAKRLDTLYTVAIGFTFSMLMLQH